MKTLTHIVTDELGIHARPASMLVKAANQFQSNIMIKSGEKEANCKAIFGVMGLGVKKDYEITLTITGEDEEAAAQALQTFLQENL